MLTKSTLGKSKRWIRTGHLSEYLKLLTIIFAISWSSLWMYSNFFVSWLTNDKPHHQSNQGIYAITPRHLPQSASCSLDVSSVYASQIHDDPHPYSRIVNCVGGEGYVDRSSARSCHLQNVCYHGPSQAVEFYADPSQPLSPILFDSNAAHTLADIPSLYVIGKQKIWGSRASKPNITYGSVPSDAQWISERFSVFASATYSDNFGHFIGDSVYGAWWMMHLFSAVLPEETAIVFHGRDSRFYQDIFKNMANNVLLASQFKRTRVCFRNLLVGDGMLEYERGPDHNEGFGNQLTRFRTYVLCRHGLDPLFQPREHTITIFITSGKRSVKGQAECNARIQNILQDEHIKVNFFEPERINFKEQLMLMMETTLFIGINGGGAFIGQFLPFGASAVFYDSWINGTSKRFGKDAQFWNNMPHIRTFWYTLRNQTDIVGLPSPSYFRQRLNLDCPRLLHLAAHALVASSKSLGIPVPLSASRMLAV